MHGMEDFVVFYVMILNFIGYTQSNACSIVNYELKCMWKEAFLVYFEVLSQHLLGGSEEIHRKPESG
jgi:hypothetical protein